MSNFAFKGRNGRGELVEGIVDAVTSDAVAAQLMAGGVVPVSIEPTLDAVSVVDGGGWLQALLANSPHAVAAAKTLVREVAGRPVDDALLADTAQRIADIRASKQGREGVASFLEKRKPEWSQL